MFKIFVLFLAFFYSTISFSDEANIKNIVVEGKTKYLVQAGVFANENTALQLKFKLSAIIKQPVNIDFSKESKTYFVNLGPVDSEAQAQTILKQLTESKPLEMGPNPPPNSSPSKNSKRLWNLKNADIRTVIEEISQVTGKNFVIDPRVQGKISIVSGTALSDKELYQVFLSMLQISGFAAIPSGEVIKIVPNIDSRNVSSDLLSDLRNPPKGDAMLTEIIPVHYVPAEQLVPVLRPLMPQWSNVSAYAPSNMLILSGRANNIRHLASIIKQVDSSSANGVDIVHLKYSLAMDIVSTLKELIKSQPNNLNRTAPMLAADDRSNTILLSGSRTDRIRLRMLIAKLDRENSQGLNSTTQVVYLNYLRAEDLVPILAGIAQANFSGTVGTTIGSVTRPQLDSTSPTSSLVNSSGQNTGDQNSGTGTEPMAPATSVNPAATPNTSASNQAEGSTKPTVQIIAEPNTNSIILNAPATLIRILKTVINQLDIKPAQLLIEALVAEVDESDIANLGIEWGSNQQSGNPGSFRPGFAILNSKTSINDFQAQLYALARLRKANILSTPSVVVLDNRQAKILVGKQVSVASTTYPNNAGGTTVASPYVTFDRVNVALHLYVRPQITRGRGIQLQIDQGNDTLDPAETVNVNNPTFKVSSIVTAVHVESGDIVVLGGLTQDSLANDDNRLPILGDIPGVGRLFQRKLRNREKRVLMVFIRPIILRSEKDNLDLSNSKYTDIRQYQLQWLKSQTYDETNKEVVLPPQSEADLPRPFELKEKKYFSTMK